MDSHIKSFTRLMFSVLIFVVVLAGCSPERPKPVLKMCPGKNSAPEALIALKKSSGKLRGFIGYGRGRVSFYEEGKDKPRNEKIPTVKLWFEPPGSVRFWGDVAFNPRGLDVGSNDTEFWLAAKPKEIGNVYIWGLWAEQDDSMELLLSPKILLESFGIIKADDGEQWRFIADKSGDVLELYDARNRLLRRVHIENCEYRISSIEYFEHGRERVITLELGDYRDIDGMFAPAEIRIVNHLDGDKTETFEIILKSIKSADTIKSSVFAKPDTRGFKDVYRMVNGKAVEQSGPK